MSYIQKDEVGVEIQASVTESDEATIVDLSDAITKEIVFKSPTGIVFAQSAEFTSNLGSDGVITWTTAVDGDGNPYINEVGLWSVQVVWTEAGGVSRKSTIVTLEVNPNLE